MRHFELNSRLVASVRPIALAAALFAGTAGSALVPAYAAGTLVPDAPSTGIPGHTEGQPGSGSIIEPNSAPAGAASNLLGVGSLVPNAPATGVPGHTEGQPGSGSIIEPNSAPARSHATTNVSAFVRQFQVIHVARTGQVI